MLFHYVGKYGNYNDFELCLSYVSYIMELLDFTFFSFSFLLLPYV